MKINIEYKDIKFIASILEEKNSEYRDQIVTGYTDDFTPLDKLKELEEKQKIIVALLDMIGEL